MGCFLRPFDEYVFVLCWQIGVYLEVMLSMLLLILLSTLLLILFNWYCLLLLGLFLFIFQFFLCFFFSFVIFDFLFVFSYYPFCLLYMAKGTWKCNFLLQCTQIIVLCFKKKRRRNFAVTLLNSIDGCIMHCFIIFVSSIIIKSHTSLTTVSFICSKWLFSAIHFDPCGFVLHTGGILVTTFRKKLRGRRGRCFKLNGQMLKRLGSVDFGEDWFWNLLFGLQLYSTCQCVQLSRGVVMYSCAYTWLLEQFSESSSALLYLAVRAV